MPDPMPRVGEELDDCVTPASTAEMYGALYNEWRQQFGEPPAQRSIVLLVAQWALETGWGKSMHCHNIGNIKSLPADGRDFTFYPCGEELPESTAVRLRDASPDLVFIRTRYPKMFGDKSIPWASVEFKPKHPVARFRAYRTLAEGVTDYLLLIRIRFRAAWPAVIAGDPIAFAHLLKVAGYYTAKEETYASSLSQIYTKLFYALEHEAVPVLSAADEAEIRAMTAMSLDALAREEATRKP